MVLPAPVLGFKKIVEKEVFNLSLLAIETFWYHESSAAKWTSH
jgi:hypothetical protein